MEQRRPRIMMLGWEYPPRVAGGLGKASQGLARGLTELGVTVDFVLPHLSWRMDGPMLAVGGVEAWLASEHAHSVLASRSESPSGLRMFAIPARLNPYARPLPPDPLPPDSVPPDPPPPDSVPPGPVPPDTLVVAHASTVTATPDFLVPLYGHDLGQEVARFGQAVMRLAPQLDVDLVHANDWMTFPAAFAAAHAAGGLPVFLHVHSTEYDRSGEAVDPLIAGIEREAFAHATHIFAVSRYTAHILTSRYAVPETRISVVYNAPDATTRDVRHTLASTRAPWIVFLGRLTFQKGPDHFLRAAAQVAQLNPEARFLVAGSGDMEASLHALAADLGIAERVVFTGFLAPAAVDALLAHARMLVMPSVSEPFGLVALEALRQGTPVIVSRQSGVREVLGHALEVDFWDHDKLADQMLALLRLPALDAQLVEAGGAALGHLSWRASATRVFEHYQRAVTWR